MAGRLDLHLLDLAAEPCDPDLLSADERRRAASYRRSQLARRFAAARCGVRRRLAMTVGLDPAAITITCAPSGKPSLTGFPEIAYSLSRSGDVGLLAIAIAAQTADPIGIDIEPQAPPPEADSIARHWFGDADRQAYDALPSERRGMAFMRFWTRKEAVAKAAGGISTLPPESFAVGLDGTRKVSGTPWQVGSLMPLPGYVAALATSEAIDIPEMQSVPNSPQAMMAG